MYFLDKKISISCEKFRYSAYKVLLMLTRISLDRYELVPTALAYVSPTLTRFTELV